MCHGTRVQLTFTDKSITWEEEPDRLGDRHVNPGQLHQCAVLKVAAAAAAAVVEAAAA